MSYAQVASNVQVCVAKKATTTTYVQQKVTNKKMTPYTGDLVCSPFRGSSRKPYCAVCFKAGKPLDVYTNHYTKSSLGPDAVVVCPTILAAACSYCKKTGHFKSVCPILKEKEKNGVKRDVVPSKQHTLPIQRVMPSISAFSAFAALDMDSDDEDVVMVKRTEPRPVTQKIITADTEKNVITYASVCASTQSTLNKTPLCDKDSLPQEFVVLDSTNSSKLSGGEKQHKEVSSWFDSSSRPTFTVKKLTHSWADDDYWSDEE